MARFSKNNSNFIIRKKHQSIEGGTILERDWSTIGERHVIESGKRKVYGDSGFLFTDSTRPGLKKRNRSGEWEAPLTLDDITDNVNDSVNIIQLPKSNDLRDYAYWGSAKELVRSSIENIVKWFPGRIWAEDKPIYIPNENGDGMNVISNIIGDGHGNYIFKTITENEVIIDNGDCITFGDEPKPCLSFSCDTDIIEDNSNIGLWLLHNPFQINLINTNLQIGKYDNPLRALAINWKQYLLNGYDIKGYKVWIKPFNECDKDYTIIYDITIQYRKNKDILTGHIYGLKLGKNILWCTTLRGLDIRPKLKIIEDYFKNLQGLDKVLLTRETYPLYTANFITPVEISYNYYVYVAKLYQWPSTDYCIDVEGIGFELYIDKLYKLSELIDNLWANNLWENMTHESIKNFDWTYQREYEEGDAADNIEGGNRMEQILQIMGAHFDDMKRWVDNIKHKNTITYDGNNNLPNAELSDKCTTLGWEIYSTKINTNDNIYLDSASLFENNVQWYYNLNPNQVNQNYIDNEFMRRLALSTKEIFRTKGTKQAIEMVFGMFGFGENDFEITERYYGVKRLYKKDDIYRFYRQNSNVNPDIDGDNYTLLEGVNSLQEWVKSKINENNGNPILGDDLPMNIQIGELYYDLDDTMTVGQFLAYANNIKNIVHNYDDVFSGVPLKVINIDGEEYIAPYFSQDKIYDGDVQFETNGGWGKHINSFNQLDNVVNQNYNYLETLPYIEIVQNCSQLLTINPYTIGEKTIFYVMDTSDYVEFNENIPDGLSHYFKLINPINPNLKQSWKTIPMIDLVEEEYNNFCNSNTAFTGVTYTDYLEAVYHDNMIQDNLGNNPHCGYAKYDLGTEYLEYCKQPFKYSIDNYLITDYDILESLKFLTFDIETIYTTEKMINFIESENENQTIKYEYYLPSKLLILKNNINNDQYKDYLNNVILKYVLQVIPSTTILVLENCLKYSEVFTITYNYIDVDGHIIKDPTVLNKNINASLTIQVPDVDCYNYVECKYHDTGVNIDDLYINNITENIIIDIIYKSNKHNVTVIVEPEELSDTVNIEINSDKCGNIGNININNNSTCYRYSGLWLNNMLITDTNPAIFDVSNNPTSNIEYVAKFELKKHIINIIKPNIPITIKYSINDGETNVLTDDIIEVRCGDNIKITTDNKIPGYQFNQWNYRPETNIVPPTNNIIEITSINEDYIIEPTYIDVIEKYTLTIEKPEEVDTCKIGIRTPKNTGDWYVHNITKIFEIEANQSVEVKIIDNIISSYKFKEWASNNSLANIDGTIITIDTMDNNYTIKPIYEYQTYTVTINQPVFDNVSGDNVNRIVSIQYIINNQVREPQLTDTINIDVPAGGVIEIIPKNNISFNFTEWLNIIPNNNYIIDEESKKITITVKEKYELTPKYERIKYKVETIIYDPENYNGNNWKIGQTLYNPDCSVSEQQYEWSVPGVETVFEYPSGSNIIFAGHDRSYFEGFFKKNSTDDEWKFITVKNGYVLNNLSEDITVGASFGVAETPSTTVYLEKNGQRLSGDYTLDVFNYEVMYIKPEDPNTSLAEYYSDYNQVYITNINNSFLYRPQSKVPLCFEITSINRIQTPANLVVSGVYVTDRGDSIVTTLDIDNNKWYETIDRRWRYDLQIPTINNGKWHNIIINFITENN